jgi:hypothetical protein
MMSFRSKLVLYLMLTVLAAAGVSCSRPTSSEQFVSVDKREANGLYRFTLDMSDSLAAYDVSFYSRIDANRLKFTHAKDFSMMVTWIAPSGQRYRETVYFGVFDESAGSNFFSSQYVKPYRTGLVPVEYGVWEMNVLVNSGAEVPGLRGLGVVCKKH